MKYFAIPEDIAEKLGTPIAELGLSTRARNALIRGSIEYVEQLVKMEYDRLLMLRNMGVKTAQEVKGKVKDYGVDCW